MFRQLWENSRWGPRGKEILSQPSQMNTYNDAIEDALKDKLADLISVVFTNLAQGVPDAEAKANFERGLAILNRARIIVQGDGADRLIRNPVVVAL